MPLTTPAQILAVTKGLVAFREDWDLEGVRQHVEKLAADPRPWPVLLAQAFGQAAVVSNRTPLCILSPLSDAPAVVPPPLNDPMAGVGTEWCGTHLCNTTLRNNGERVCCWQDRVFDAPARPVSPTVPLSRPPGPCPPDVKERIEAMRRESAVKRAKAESRTEAPS